MTEESERRDPPPGGEAGDRDDLIRSRPELREEIGMILDWLDDERSGKTASGSDREGAASSEGNDAPIPKVVDDFRIVSTLGSGALSIVYEAEQISIPRRVALKILRSHLSLSDREILLFRREAEAAARQSHPGIVAIYSVGEHGGVHFIAEEMVPGGRSLEDRLNDLRTTGQPPVGYFRETARFIAAVAEALHHAHGAGVIHRDVKPSNLLITADGRPKVSDFGLAKIEDALALSRPDAVSGTPFYMSPEQSIRGSKIDARTDIFSLGVTLYEALTLEKPFVGESQQAVIDRVLFSHVRDARTVSSRVPKDLAVIAGKALEKNPDRRYRSMAELAGDLKRFLAGEPILARPPGRLRRLRRWTVRNRVRLLAAGFLLTLLVLAAVFVKNRRQKWRAAEALCSEVRQALVVLNDFPATFKWCRKSENLAPCASLYEAFWEIDTGNPEDAVKHLQDCVAHCRDQGERELEKEAHYLLAVMLRRQADDARVSQEQRAGLLEDARRSLQRAGRGDPLSGDFLVWRENEDPGDGEEEGWHRRTIRVNRSHYIVNLRRGIGLLDMTHTGGEAVHYKEAIDRFRKVLAARPGDAAALTLLGRALFFHARSFNRLEVLGESIELLERAAECPRGAHWAMTFTTLGQALLLAGDSEEAARCFERALKVRIDAADQGNAKGRKADIHNDYKSLALVLVRRALEAETDEEREAFLDGAESHLDEATDRYGADSRVHAARADLYLFREKNEQAMEAAYLAMQMDRENGMFYPGYEKARTASAFLAGVRIELKIGDESKAKYALSCIETASHSPYDLSVACHYLFAFPVLGENKPGRLGSLARMVRVETSKSPICLSARGVRNLHDGRPEEAARYLDAALEARGGWPETTRHYYWYETARDLCFLAMTHDALSRKDAGAKGSAAAEKAQEYLSRAKRLIKERGKPYEHRELLEKVWTRARDALQVPREALQEER